MRRLSTLLKVLRVLIIRLLNGLTLGMRTVHLASRGVLGRLQVLGAHRFFNADALANAILHSVGRSHAASRLRPRVLPSALRMNRSESIGASKVYILFGFLAFFKAAALIHALLGHVESFLDLRVHIKFHGGLEHRVNVVFVKVAHLLPQAFLDCLLLLMDQLFSQSSFAFYFVFLHRCKGIEIATFLVMIGELLLGLADDFQVVRAFREGNVLCR